MAHHKRKRPKYQRAGYGNKPWKDSHKSKNWQAPSEKRKLQPDETR